MAERKVLVKYFPKNFDPERLVKRGRGKDRLMNVRNMLPMSLRCNTCSNYLYIGTKFNMRMEICNDEMYLGIKIFRFYLKCTFCYAEITFKTDPKNHDYVVETGGTRNYDPHRDALQAEKLLRKLKQDEEEGNSMKSLENKTYDSKREMELMEVLDQIKNQNKRQAALVPEELLKKMFEEEIVKQCFTEEEEEEISQTFEAKKQAKMEELRQQAAEKAAKLAEQPAKPQVKQDKQGYKLPSNKKIKMTIKPARPAPSSSPAESSTPSLSINGEKSESQESQNSEKNSHLAAKIQTPAGDAQPKQQEKSQPNAEE